LHTDNGSDVLNTAGYDPKEVGPEWGMTAWENYREILKDAEVNQVLTKLRMMLPHVKAMQGAPYHSQSQGGVENSNKYGQKRLCQWMKQHKTLHWWMGLKHLNYQALVSDVNASTKMTPYEFLFGRKPPVTGLANIRLHNDLLDSFLAESVAVGFLMLGGPAPLLERFWEARPERVPMELFGDNSQGSLRALYDKHPGMFPNVSDPASLEHYMRTLTEHRNDADVKLIAINLEQDREIKRLRKAVEELSHQQADGLQRSSQLRQGPVVGSASTNSASIEASPTVEFDKLPLKEPGRLQTHHVLREAMCLMARTDPDTANAYDRPHPTLTAAAAGAGPSPPNGQIHEEPHAGGEPGAAKEAATLTAARTEFLNDVDNFVDSAADVDRFVEETVAKMADLLRADDVREPWLSARAQATFNSCRHGAKIMRQSTKANGEQPRDGECVWVTKDRLGAKNHSVLPQCVVVGVRERKNRERDKQCKVAFKAPFDIVLVEEWLDETHVLRAPPNVTAQSLGLAGAVHRWQHGNTGNELRQYKYDVLVTGIKSLVARAKGKKLGCKCHPGEGYPSCSLSTFPPY
jgi:hypothetical protein